MPAILNYAEAYQAGLQQRYAANGLLYTQKLWMESQRKTRHGVKRI